MTKSRKHFPEQTDTRSVLSEVPDSELGAFVDRLLANIPPKNPISDGALKSHSLSSTGQNPAGPEPLHEDPDVEWIMREYGLSREKAEKLAKMI